MKVEEMEIELDVPSLAHDKYGLLMYTYIYHM